MQIETHSLLRLFPKGGKEALVEQQFAIGAGDRFAIDQDGELLMGFGERAGRMWLLEIRDGASLNGKPVRGEQPLATGDVIEIAGDVYEISITGVNGPPAPAAGVAGPAPAGEGRVEASAPPLDSIRKELGAMQAQITREIAAEKEATTRKLAELAASEREKTKAQLDKALGEAKSAIEAQIKGLEAVRDAAASKLSGFLGDGKKDTDDHLAKQEESAGAQLAKSVAEAQAALLVQVKDHDTALQATAAKLAEGLTGAEQAAYVRLAEVVAGKQAHIKAEIARLVAEEQGKAREILARDRAEASTHLAESITSTLARIHGELEASKAASQSAAAKLADQLAAAEQAAEARITEAAIKERAAAEAEVKRLIAEEYKAAQERIAKHQEQAWAALDARFASLEIECQARLEANVAKAGEAREKQTLEFLAREHERVENDIGAAASRAKGTIWKQINEFFATSRSDPETHLKEYASEEHRAITASLNHTLAKERRSVAAQIAELGARERKALKEQFANLAAVLKHDLRNEPESDKASPDQVKAPSSSEGGRLPALMGGGGRKSRGRQIVLFLVVCALSLLAGLVLKHRMSRSADAPAETPPAIDTTTWSETAAATPAKSWIPPVLTPGHPADQPAPQSAAPGASLTALDTSVDALLARTRVLAVVANLRLDRLDRLNTIMDAEFTGRVGQRMSLHTLLGLLRQLRQLQSLPVSLELALSGSDFTSEKIASLLGPPDEAQSGPVWIPSTKMSIYGNTPSVLRPSRPLRVDADGLITVLYSREFPRSSGVEPPKLGMAAWVRYGYLDIAFPPEPDPGEMCAIRIDTISFLAAHDTHPNPRQMAGSPSQTSRIECHSPVWSLAVAPDGKSAAAGLGNSEILLLDLGTGKESRRLSGHTGEVLCVAFSPDGKRILSGSTDRTIRLWEVASGKMLAAFTAHAAGVNCVAFSRDGSRAVSGGSDMMVILWDLETRTELKWFMGHKGGVNGVAFSPDGQRIVSGSNDCTVRMWSVASGRETICLRGHGTIVQSVAFSPDGKHLLSSSGGPIFDDDDSLLPGLDHTIRLWDAETGEELRRFVGHDDWVISVAFSPDGKQIVSGSGGGVFGGKVVFPGNENNIRLWDVHSGLEIASLPNQENIVRAVAFLPDAKGVVSAGWDQSLRVWDIAAN